MMNIEYENDGKRAVFNGESFTRDDKTGYYLTTNNANRPGRRLHRVIWEYYYGIIPQSYVIHHKDHNRGNNSIDNLELLTEEDHRKRHSLELTEEERRWRAENIVAKAAPAAVKWHSSEEGKKFHKMQYRRTKEKLNAVITFKCEYCGNEYKATINGQNRFCSNRCKSASRRREGLDMCERTCVICGRTFEINKYAPTKTCSRKCACTLRTHRGNSA